MTVLHDAALYGHASCVESLLKAGADASLKNEVSDSAEGQGGRRVGSGRGAGRGWGKGPCADAESPLRAASPRRPAPALSPRGGRLHSACTPPALRPPPLPVAVETDGVGPR